MVKASWLTVMHISRANYRRYCLTRERFSDKITTGWVRVTTGRVRIESRKNWIRSEWNLIPGVYSIDQDRSKMLKTIAKRFATETSYYKNCLCWTNAGRSLPVSLRLLLLASIWFLVNTPLWCVQFGSMFAMLCDGLDWTTQIPQNGSHCYTTAFEVCLLPVGVVRYGLINMGVTIWNRKTSEAHHTPSGLSLSRHSSTSRSVQSLLNWTCTKRTPGVCLI